jgi:ubiquinone/menaquinone biosynthesis C-methylase UbiE
VSEKKALDKWYQWLQHRRFGGDEKVMKQAMAYLFGIRDRILENIGPLEGKTVLDMGAGDGLIAFGLLEKVGKTGKVIFNDISQDLIDHCRTLTQEMGVADRCEFLLTPAEDLQTIPDETVDAVTARSVLIYIEDKQAVFDGCYRILKDRGCMSIFEPINRFGYCDSPDCFWGCDVTPVQDLAQRVRALYESIQPPDSDPMLNFDERDLLAMAEQAGFQRIDLDLHAKVRPAERHKWEVFSKVAGNPRIPTLEEAIAQTLTPAEGERFVAHLRPLVESGAAQERSAQVYLSAFKESHV